MKLNKYYDAKKSHYNFVVVKPLVYMYIHIQFVCRRGLFIASTLKQGGYLISMFITTFIYLFNLNQVHKYFQEIYKIYITQRQ